MSGHAGQLPVDPRYQPFANIGVMERQQMADRALRQPEIEIDRPLVAAHQTGRKISECTFYRHHRNLVIFVLNSDWFELSFEVNKNKVLENLRWRVSNLFVAINDLIFRDGFSISGRLYLTFFSMD
ncbi:hypothetical protein [Burkholderia sp. AU6039]|uniref:hypothetical protein n=1 Tax=Burkholderia sp. AU6039 TaxID=2015344 RepID=UPI00211B71E6|nr:hypothetical protein [Burkholderia sp. AU6039]